MRFIIPLPGIALALSQTACIPFAVGSTARPVPVGEYTSTTSVFIVPGSLAHPNSTLRLAQVGLDTELRSGFDKRSDMGLRVASATGIIVTYKRRLDGESTKPTAATSIQLGGGFVNMGEHAEFEASLLWSAREDPRFTPYGGLRVIQVAPLSHRAVHDTPTAGAYFGFRMGTADFGVSPELGVFHDKSALNLRKRERLIVPSLNVHGTLWGPLRRVTRGRR